MIDSRHFNKVTVLLMALVVFLSTLAVFNSDCLSQEFGGQKAQMEYETKLFDTSSPLDIDIEIKESDWNDLLENAMQEEYHSCTICINGTKFEQVGIRTKGNTSLMNIANDDTTNRYSLKVEFDHYMKNQSCYGLDKLILNNNYADATNMKEAIVYDMYQYLEADASLYNYARISVNGEYWGVYLALEGVEDSFLRRNYGLAKGCLYKPETFGGDKMDRGDQKGQGPQGGQKPEGQMEPPEGRTRPGGGQQQGGRQQQGGGQEEGGGQMPDGMNPMEGKMPGGMNPPDGKMPDGMNPPDGQVPDGMNPPDGQAPDGMNPPDGQMPNGMNPPDGQKPDGMTPPNGQKPGGMHGADGQMSPNGGNGSDLNYSDDELDSYSAIWDGEVDKTSKKDHARVVRALKGIAGQENLETYMNVDNMLKYLAVHTFSVNLDSLSGNMAHNYYLYEQNGQLNMIPWDYNLSWGGFSSGGRNLASDTVNFPIDTPFSSGISLENRQFFAALLEKEEYLAKYHAYLQQLCDGYVNGGKLEETYERIRSQIDSLVETDPTSFYSYEEYETAVQTLRQVLELRTQSISGQLSGTVPGTWEGQEKDSSACVDASGIDLSVMGFMQNGRK